MKQAIIIFALIILSHPAIAQTPPPVGTGSFPKSDFVLHDAKTKPEKARVVLGPMHTDASGRTTGTIAIYGGSSLIQVSSLSFSGDGKLLAVGSTPGRVDVWDFESQKKLHTFAGGSTVCLSRDGRLLAKDGEREDAMGLYDVGSRKLQRRIARVSKRAENVVDHLEFSADGSMLDVTANGDDDSVYDVSSGKLLATLTNTKHAHFSNDGTLLIGGNHQHLIVWNTKDWTKISDQPNGPDYVTEIAVSPGKDLVVVGGPNSARLLRLVGNQEVAKVGSGYTNFAAFSPDGSLIFTYSGSGFAIWDTTGKRSCGTSKLGNGTVSLSTNAHWLASAPPGGGSTDVLVWNVQNLLAKCGVVPIRTN